jgi:hypothetical protein
MDDPRPHARDEAPDLLVGEIERDRRERRVLVVAAALGIVSGAVMGLVFILGALAEPTTSARGFRHGALVFVLGPPVVSMAIGYVVYAVRRRRRRRS